MLKTVIKERAVYHAADVDQVTDHHRRQIKGYVDHIRRLEIAGFAVHQFDDHYPYKENTYQAVDNDPAPDAPLFEMLLFSDIAIAHPRLVPQRMIPMIIQKNGRARKHARWLSLPLGRYYLTVTVILTFFPLIFAVSFAVPGLTACITPVSSAKAIVGLLLISSTG